MKLSTGYCQLAHRNEVYWWVIKRKAIGKQREIGEEVWLCGLLDPGYLIPLLEAGL